MVINSEQEQAAIRKPLNIVGRWYEIFMGQMTFLMPNQTNKKQIDITK